MLCGAAIQTYQPCLWAQKGCGACGGAQCSSICLLGSCINGRVSAYKRHAHVQHQVVIRPVKLLPPVLCSTSGRTQYPCVRARKCCGGVLVGGTDRGVFWRWLFLREILTSGCPFVCPLGSEFSKTKQQQRNLLQVHCSPPPPWTVTTQYQASTTHHNISIIRILTFIYVRAAPCTLICVQLPAAFDN